MDTGRNIAFMTLAAEDYDNIGSSSVAYSMTGDRNGFPIPFVNQSDEIYQTIKARVGDSAKTETKGNFSKICI